MKKHVSVPPFFLNSRAGCNLKHAALALLVFLIPGSAIAQISADFYTGGAVRIGASSTTCNGSALGGLRYSSAGGGKIELCNGSVWTNVSESSIDSLSDGISNGTSTLFLGKDAGIANTGTNNTSVGINALKANTTGSNNTAVGYRAMTSLVTGSYNMAFGYDTLSTLTAGADNVAVGANALASSTNTNANVAIGSESSMNNSTGSNNVAVGYGALRNGTTGSNNVAVGYGAGFTGTAITTGTNNTFVGYQAGANANNYTNGMALGNGAVLTASNRIVLGNTAIAAIYAQVTSITAISDRRRKKDIAPLDMGLAFIRQLKPVEYRFNNGDETLRYGLIAQDLAEILAPDLRAIVEKADDKHSLALIQKENDKDGTYRVNYGELTGPIIKAIQEQQDIIDEQNTTIAQQKTALEELAREIEAIKKELKAKP